jgi:hypothetical protein
MEGETMPYTHGEVCKHETLKRKCDLCWSEWEAGNYTARIAELLARVRELEAELSAMESVADRERIQRKQLEANYESLSNSITVACANSGCLNAHELRVALDQARERNTVLKAEVRAKRARVNGCADVDHPQLTLEARLNRHDLRAADVIAERATDAANALEGT